MVKLNERKDPSEIVSEAYSAAGRIQNADFVADATRSGDAKGAEVQSITLRRAKGKQEEMIAVSIAEIPTLISILEQAQDVLIPKVNSYGLLPDEPVEEKGRRK